MSALTIRIYGEKGAGKSVLAQHLGAYLKAQGMDVSVSEPEASGRGFKVPIVGAELKEPRRIAIHVKDPV